MLYAKISRPNSAGIEFLRIPMYNGNSFIYIFNNCYKQKERQLMQQYIRSELLDRFEFQNYDGDDLFEKIDEFEKEFKDFEEEPIVREYLAAELEICRRIQEINASITDVVDIDMDIA